MPDTDNSTGSLAKRELTCRKRKAHRKSRTGCRNCKLRRVKCDENRPWCQKCVEFDVVCNYDREIADLQPRASIAEAGSMDAVIERSALSSNRPILHVINRLLRQDASPPLASYGCLQVDYSDLARMERFQSRTVLSIGTKTTAQYFKAEVVQLACSHHFLMNLVLSVTACHDRFLMGMATSKPSRVETYHMSQGVRAFNYKLSHPIRDEDRDAIFLAASLLGVAAFGLEAASVEDIWPLSDGDFGWLNLSGGKKAIWELVNPSRPGSVWQPLTTLHPQKPFGGYDVPTCGPSVFDHLYSDDLDSNGASSALPNPYRKTARCLAALLDLDYNDSTWPKFISFICHLDPGYKALLESKDPWAMLMLAYWYVKVCRGPWWVCTRAIRQGQAIVIYLERHHSDDLKLQEAIKYPRAELDLAQSEGWGGF